MRRNTTCLCSRDLREKDRNSSIGAARFLLTANPHLGRALRFRARRWLKSWTPADGLVKPSKSARAALREHALEARSFSPTALEKYATCPYQFFLYAVHRLAPREVHEAIEEMSPLQRGSLVHDVLFRFFSELRERDLLPVRSGRLGEARQALDEVLDTVARRAHDDLVPAIERVWQDSVESIRADLREWLRRASEDDSGYVPWRFELSFGLANRRERDASSVTAAVELDSGLRLRGSIDLVERRPDGTLRATDYKTGKARVPRGALIDGGTSLQPLFYALALEKLNRDSAIAEGRLYYCTAAGGFEDRAVALDEAGACGGRRCRGGFARRARAPLSAGAARRRRLSLVRLPRRLRTLRGAAHGPQGRAPAASAGAPASVAMTAKRKLVDAEARRRIREDLDATLFVEAARRVPERPPS